MLIRRAVFAAIVLAACNDGADEPVQPETIRDQSGAVFGWECDADSCRVTRVEGSPPLPDCGADGQAIYSYSWGSLIEITAACKFDDMPGWGALGGWGRFVVCEEDADCPSVVSGSGRDEYLCHAGLCRSVATVEEHDDLPNRWMMPNLCFGEQPRFEPYSDPDTWAAIEAACPGESINDACNAIPAGCVDPRG